MPFTENGCNSFALFFNLCLKGKSMEFHFVLSRIKIRRVTFTNKHQYRNWSAANRRTQANIKAAELILSRFATPMISNIFQS